MKSYLIIGNGVAGTTAAESIRNLDLLSRVTMVTDEGLPFYYRIRLNEFLAGELGEDKLVAKKIQWYKDLGIELLLNTRVVEADAGARIVTAADGRQLTYDSLLLATGSHSFLPPINGSGKKGIFAIRTVQDCREIKAFCQGIDNVVLIGGGLLGLEAGNALLTLGKKVTVVEFFPRLLPRQLDEEGGRRLQGIMEKKGFTFRLGAKTKEIKGDDQVNGVLLESGEILPAGMVIISAGVRPNLELARILGVECDKGVKVNDRLQTSQENIYAAGDVAEFNGMSYGIWPAAMEQGKIAGSNMAGGDLPYTGSTMANNLKVAGVALASAGEIDADNRFEARVESTDLNYRKIVSRDNRIIGCIMLGDTKNFQKLTKAIANGQTMSEITDLL